MFKNIEWTLNWIFSPEEKEDAGTNMSEDDFSDPEWLMNDNDERQDIAYAELMLEEFDQQPFYHKYWGRRRTESFKHS